MSKSKNTLLALGAAVTLSFIAAPAFSTSSTLQATPLAQGYLVAKSDQAKTEGTKEVAATEKTAADTKTKEGEAKCGGKKMKEGKCGEKMEAKGNKEEKCDCSCKDKEGKCGAKKEEGKKEEVKKDEVKKEEGKKSDSKKKEGAESKCGSGTCGGKK